MSTTQDALLTRYADSLTGVFGRPARVLVRGEGVHVWDADGRRYTDLLAGIAVNSLGHAHPAVVDAVTAAAAGKVVELRVAEGEQVRPRQLLARLEVAETVGA